VFSYSVFPELVEQREEQLAARLRLPRSDRSAKAPTRPRAKRDRAVLGRGMRTLLTRS
jgi:hypothetical protein